MTGRELKNTAGVDFLRQTLVKRILCLYKPVTCETIEAFRAPLFNGLSVH